MNLAIDPITNQRRLAPHSNKMWLAHHSNERWLAPHSIVSLFPVNEYVPESCVALAISKWLNKQQMRTGPAEKRKYVNSQFYVHFNLVFSWNDSQHCHAAKRKLLLSVVVLFVVVVVVEW